MPYVDVDQVAGQLAFFANLARSMPPGWDNAKCNSIVCGPQGQYIGKALHGRGLYLDMDPKYLGITRGVIPHLYHKSPIARLRDKLGKVFPEGFAGRPYYDKRYGRVVDPERGAISTYDGIIAARAGGKANDIWINKASFTSTALDWYDMGRATGSPGPFTYNSTTAPTQTAMNRATSGAWSTGLFNPSGSDKKYLLTLGWTSTQQINSLILIDCHVQGGSFRLTVTTTETVASPVAVTRDYYPDAGALGAGAYMVGVTTTGASATATNLTIGYHDQNNNLASTVIVNPATATIASQVWPDSSSAVGVGPFWALATDDFGVRDQVDTDSSVALAAGVLAILIATPLVMMPGIAANTYSERDSTIQIDGLQELANVSQVIGCLNALALPNTTSTGSYAAFMRACAG